MLYIPVILGTVRRGRRSERVARFVLSRLSARQNVQTELVDLAQYNFPLLEERLAYRDDPPPGLQDFSDKMSRADAIIIVSPEYNHGYPGALKNALDYLYPEYENKPFGLVTVSSGSFGGARCQEQLRQVVQGLGGFAVPGALSVPKVDDQFDEQGNPKSSSWERRVNGFFDEVTWFAEAVAERRRKVTTPAA